MIDLWILSDYRPAIYTCLISNALSIVRVNCSNKLGAEHAIWRLIYDPHHAKQIIFIADRHCIDIRHVMSCRLIISVGAFDKSNAFEIEKCYRVLQGRSHNFSSWGGLTFTFLSACSLSSPFLFFICPLFLPLFPAPLLQIELGVWENAVSSSRGPKRSPGLKGILTHFRLSERISWQHFSRVCEMQEMHSHAGAW